MPSLTQSGTATVRMRLPFPSRSASTQRFFPELDGLDLERGQLLAAQGAAYQESQDHVIAFALDAGAVGHGQQILGLFAGQPVPQPSPLLPEIRDIGQVSCFLDPDQPQASGLAHELADGRQPDINSGSGKRIHRSPVLEHECPGERTPGREQEQVIERFRVVPPGMR